MDFLFRYLLGIFLFSVLIVVPTSGQLIAKSILKNVVSTAIDLTYKELSVPTTLKKEVIVDKELGCTCKPFSLCQTYESNPIGYLQIDIRTNIGPCHSYLDVCCNDTLSSIPISVHTDGVNENLPEAVSNSPEIVWSASDDSIPNKDSTSEFARPSITTTTLTSSNDETKNHESPFNLELTSPPSSDIITSSSTTADSRENFESTSHELSGYVELSSPPSSDIVTPTSTTADSRENFESTSHESSGYVELSSSSSSDIVTSTSTTHDSRESFESTSNESSGYVELSSSPSSDIVTSTSTTPDSRENSESTSHESSSNIELLSSPSPSDIVTSASSSTDSIEKTESHNTESNSHLTEATTTIKPAVTKPHKCGLWNKDGVGFRILNAINGESNYGEYPAMVAILGEDTSKAGDTKLLYRCGGSLIKPNVVLTAAHCVLKKDHSALVVRAGEWDLQTDKEIYVHQDRRLSKVTVHKDYYAGGLFNDIALLFTDVPFDLKEHIQTICLPEQGQKFDHSLCYSSGWGKDVIFNNYTIAKKTASGVENELGHYQVSILKKVELPIIPTEKCEEDLKKTRLGPKFRLHKSFMCAGGLEGKDTCKGDGGSPLMCPSESDPSTLIQAGIVSWGIGCGNTFPGVYVDVAHFREWIDNEINI